MSLPPISAGTDSATSAAARRVSDQKFAIALTAVFAALLGVLLAFHVLWRDEAQAFVVARDLSLAGLFAHMPYEGHPALWHLLLWGVTQLTVRPEWMQALHGAMAAGTIYVVARHAPFTRVQKVLLAFGYFPLFEYGVISRNYQMAFLLAVIFAAVWQRRRTAFWTQGILLALLCHTNIFGIILVAAIGVFILLEAAVTSEEHRAAAKHVYRFLGAGFLVALSAAAAIWRLMPPADAGYLTKWNFDLAAPHVAQTLASLWSAYVPVPQMQVHFWNSNILNDVSWEAAFGVPLFLMMAAALWKRPAVLASFVVGTLGILAFIHIKLFEWINLRYTGNLFILLVLCLWLAWPQVHAFVRRGWTGLLAVHVLAAALAVVVISMHEWSPGLDAARFLQGELRPNEIVVTDSESIIAELAVYMPGEKFYLPREKDTGTFAFWNNKGGPRTLEVARRLARDSNGPVIIVRRDPMGEQWHVQKLASFTDAIVGDENFYFYQVSPP